MTLGPVKTVFRDHFNEVLLNLNFISSLEPKEPTIPHSLEVKVLRGLFWVHLYSAFEGTIRSLFQNSLIKIKGLNPKYCHLILSFSPIALSKPLQSFLDSGRKSLFSKSSNLFSIMESNQDADFDESLFSVFLSNVWTNSINAVLKSFGADSFVISPIQRTLIDEIVEKRNAVAHGRERAVDVGERFSCSELRGKLIQIQSFTDSLIHFMESYIDDLKFIKNSHITDYRQTA